MARRSTTLAAGTMVDTGLKQWLSAEQQPSDFYQLLGMPKFCRDRARVLACLEEASEYLFQCQNHKDKTVRDRAKTFQLQVAEARRTVSDAALWEKYDHKLVEHLRALCRQNPNFSGPNPKLDDLRRWLAMVQHVDSDRVEELVHDMLAVQQAEAPSTKPTAEKETQLNAGSNTEVVSHPRSTVSLSDSQSTQAVSPKQPGGSRSGEMRIPEVRGSVMPSTPPPVPARKETPPPPKGPALPLRKTPPPPSQQIPVPPLQTPPAGHPKPVRPGFNSLSSFPASWIFLAVFLAIFLLGMFCIFVAWAAGAFDHPRSRADVSPKNIPCLCRLTEEAPSHMFPLPVIAQKQHQLNRNSHIIRES